MGSLLQQRLAQLSATHPQAIVGILHGIERETLRVNADGTLAQTPHHQALGSALTHPWITTDFSESLLEFITPVSDSIETTLAQLADIHHFTVSNLSDEQLWPASMPCFISDQQQIPFARYGSSNVGRMKTLYRKGLHNRYGSMMQAISGVHFNFSLPDSFWQLYQQQLADNNSLQDFISEQYLALIRNYKRNVWLLVYLFGASPAMCKSFLEGRASRYPFQLLGKGSLYLPYATSLRMSDLGYTNSAQSSLNVTYNSLPEYISGLHAAISMPSEEYRNIGVKVDGEYQQLNANVLQIENEFYSTIRPKRTTQSGERPTCALAKRGVEYIEVRCLDVNPFSPIGITAEQMYFLDVFLLYCLLHDSPALSAAEQTVTEQNLKKVVTDGRRSNLDLLCDGQPRLMQDWAEQLFADMMPVAHYLDQAHQHSKYSGALKQFYLSLLDPAQTYSGKLLNSLLASQQDNGSVLLQLSAQYRQQLMQQPYQYYNEQQFTEAAALSIQAQQQIELQDTVSFEQYIAQYYAEVPACDKTAG
ncbi:MAG: glutamate--cysteine ligase [Gammaproteobacteria bacterium]|nr:glutamate--cysteine ligase [Gammaproteobacteria bacterium]MBU1555662.1 glutamate--cysteine ligase [Gammaproteobacteria bacterium]MBU2069297.1 glutamate--cysteine ligase [Gammaproteobacteria bacterium]MBU2183292.1 glutamate--cysteine ligase [Gammaproteobacteria bacterium]MBU2204507.1 glutamate--cysteine ligase [Gammaproteobacteria bacterium]